MKIKQSFIDRCGELTIIQLIEISKEAKTTVTGTLNAILAPYMYEYTNNVLKAAANVLKIDLKDIYEVEDLPHTL